MTLEIQHIEVHVSSIDEAKIFYVDKLGLKLIEAMPSLNLFSVKAGAVRISVFGGYEPKPEGADKRAGTHMIFRTDNIEETIEALKAKGVEFDGDLYEAPGFIRGIATRDPDGNVIEIAQYLRDPLKNKS